jgi:alpha-acetolactate decarboxylase
LTNLLQLSVLGLGLLQEGDVGVGVFSEGEEVFLNGEHTETWADRSNSARLTYRYLTYLLE